MKYFRYYETAEDFKDEYYGEKYSEPWLSYTLPQEQVNYNKTDREKALDVPLTFAVKYAGQNGKIYWKRQNGLYQSEDFCLEYKKNDGEWTEICTTVSGTWPETVTFEGLDGTFTFEFFGQGYAQYGNNDGLHFTISSEGDVYEGAVIYVYDEYGQGRDGDYTVLSFVEKTYEDPFIEVSAGDIIQFRGENPYGFFDTSTGMMGAQFTGEDIGVNMYGNFLSIMYGDEDLYSKTEFNEDIIEQYTWSYNSPFESLFYAMGIDDASGLLLPTNVFPYCYTYFFSNSGLRKAPKVLPAMKLEPYCYNSMFAGCGSLTDAPELPAMELAEDCYFYMFAFCESLVNAPSLPASTLAYGCYDYMFGSCISLTNAPSLPALKLAEYCYSNMFYGCTSLVNAPVLPATELAPGCYSSMFVNCTSLLKAPELPATELSNSCYYNMFAGCTSIQKAPLLPASYLPAMCYYGMFSGCSELNYIKCLAVSAENSYNTTTYYWVNGVSLSGTFETCQDISAATAFWGVGPNGIPYTWTVLPNELQTLGESRCLTFEILENGNIGFKNVSASHIQTIEYTKDNGQTWTEITSSSATSIPVITGDVVKFRGYNYDKMSGGTSDKRCYFEIPCLCNMSGDLNSLAVGSKNIFVKNFPYYFRYMFQGCNIVNASGVVITGPSIPEARLAGTFSACTAMTAPPQFVNVLSAATNTFKGMFEGCVSLLDTPNLQQLQYVNGSACWQMFKGCTSLTGISSMALNSVGDSGMTNIFSGCTSITTLPNITFVSAGSHSLENMFAGCTALTDASNVSAPIYFLPVTSYYSNRYGYCGGMFKDCTSLVNPPSLPAETGAPGCYNNMFFNCTSLVDAPNINIKNTNSGNSLFYAMFDGCTSLTGAPIISGIDRYTDYICERMFRACTSLEVAPTLPDVPYFKQGNFWDMFSGCTSLRYIKALFDPKSGDTIGDYRSTSNWMRGAGTGVPSGTPKIFVRSSKYENWTSDVNGTNGWPVQVENT